MISGYRIQPYKHQVEGVKKIVEHPYFALFDEMGAGKTKQVIDAAQTLFVAGEVKRVIVVAPAAVRSVWFNQEFGELSKHLWEHLPSSITEFHSRSKTWRWNENNGRGLEWIITNYDFIRSKQRLQQLMGFTGPKTMLVLDESSAVKNPNAKQTKACLTLRRSCGRVVLLNGTPITNHVGDLYSQANIMHPTILGCKSWFHFRSRYAIQAQRAGYIEIIGWQNVEDIQRRLAPYVLRRLKTDCLDLPKKLPSVVLSATLSPSTWAVYKEMRDEMLVWLNEQDSSFAPQAIVKAIRMAQITSGFIGGVERDVAPRMDVDERPDWLPFAPTTPLPTETTPSGPIEIRPLSNEKQTVLLNQIDEWLDQDPKFKLLVWCRFRFELKRLVEAIIERWPHIAVGLIWGGQSREERDDAVSLLDPRSTPASPVIVVGTPATGSMGLNLTAAHTVVYLSNDYSLKTRLQSEDRVHRPGQLHPVSYFDMVAEGPQGQRTIDHVVLKALREKDDLARWTTSAWRKALVE